MPASSSAYAAPSNASAPIVGQLQREVDRKASVIQTAVRQALGQTLDKAARIEAQSGQCKTADGQLKLYA